MPKSLRINLGHSGEIHPKPTIRPGTVLYGEIAYKPPSKEFLTSLTVNLLGKLVVKAKGQREVTQLFSVQHPILRKEEEPIALEIKSHTFPFHFVVPFVTEYNRTGTFPPDLKDEFTEIQHRVPPSRSKGDAQILYSISCVARKKESASNLNFNPLGDIPTGTELEDVQCIVELPDIPPAVPVTVQRELTPPAAKQGVFRRSSVVAVDAAGRISIISICCPDVLVLGEQYECKVGVDYRDGGPAQQDGQTWNFTLKSVEMIARTYRRLRNGSVFHDEERVPIRAPDTKPQMVDATNGLSRTILVGGADNYTAPSFKSYTISRVHRLRFGIVSLLDSKRSTAQEERLIDFPVEVLQRGETLIRRASTLPPQDVNGQLIEPPPYEDSPAYVS